LQDLVVGTDQSWPALVSVAGGGVADVRRLAVNEDGMKVIATNGYKKSTHTVGASLLRAAFRRWS
jgi:hypothetical protein